MKTPIRNATLPVFLFIITLAALLSIGVAADKTTSSDSGSASAPEKKPPPILHSFRWTQWEAVKDDNEVYMDTVLIGRGREAVEKLEAMTFQKGARLELIFPVTPGEEPAVFAELRMPVKVPVSWFYQEGDFLAKWISQGVRLTIKANGKPIEVHTLAATDANNKAINPTRSGQWNGLETVGCNFIFDGVRHVAMEEALFEFSKATWAEGSMFFVYIPKDGAQGMGEQRPLNGVGHVLEFLGTRKVNIVRLPNATIFRRY